MAQIEATEAAAPPDQSLNVRLDAPLPRELEIGEGTALFVCGTCFHREQPIVAMSFVVDGFEQPVQAHGMPRLDAFAAMHTGLDVFDPALELDPDSAEDPHLRGYRSGFWGTVLIGPRPLGAFELSVRARLADGRTMSVPVAMLRAVAPLAAPLPAPARAGPGPLVAICMATYNPPMDLFRRQLDSIRSQTHANWICVISDDRSSPSRYEAIERELAGDARFVLSRAPRRLGFYHNFERALAMVPRKAKFVALADQDDRWYPEKLSTLLEAVRGAKLAYSDVRVIDEHDELISNTYWTTRRNNYSDLLSLLIANSVTGAASLFRREVLDHALPFPPSQFGHFHDHWIALIALALGEINFVDRPLYDYVQHRDSVLGHDAANRMVALRERLGHLRKDARERVRLWRFHYFVDVSRLTVCARILQVRCGAAMTARKRRKLDRFLSAERSSLALLNLWRRGLRELLGRPETLGGEWMLAYAFSWRRLLSATARDRPTRRLRFDALPPPDLWIAPGQQAPPSSSERPSLGERIGALRLEPAAEAPVRCNVLIGALNPDDISPELVFRLNLAQRLSDYGLRTRIVTTEPVGSLPGGWERQVESASGLDGVFGRVETAFAREVRAIEVSPHDRFLATTPPTAHVAAQAAAELDRRPFLYLIEDYESLGAASGSDAALADASYRFPHVALFSGEPVTEYFRSHGLGVFAADADAQAMTFRAPVAPAPRPSHAGRRLLFLGRPERGGRANCFELGAAALEEALGAGALGGWELDCLGRIEARAGYPLGGGARLVFVERIDPSADVAVVLRLTPAIPPEALELAAAGVLTVTNVFETKTEDVLAGVSENLIPVTATVNSISAGVQTAVARVGDLDRRLRASDVSWSRSWAQALPEELIERMLASLGR